MTLQVSVVAVMYCMCQTALSKSELTEDEILPRGLGLCVTCEHLVGDDRKGKATPFKASVLQKVIF